MRNSPPPSLPPPNRQSHVLQDRKHCAQPTRRGAFSATHFRVGSGGVDPRTWFRVHMALRTLAARLPRSPGDPAGTNLLTLRPGTASSNRVCRCAQLSDNIGATAAAGFNNLQRTRSTRSPDWEGAPAEEGTVPGPGPREGLAPVRPPLGHVSGPGRFCGRNGTCWVFEQAGTDRRSHGVVMSCDKGHGGVSGSDCSGDDPLQTGECSRRVATGADSRFRRLCAVRHGGAGGVHGHIGAAAGCSLLLVLRRDSLYAPLLANRTLVSLLSHWCCVCHAGTLHCRWRRGGGGGS